MKIQKDLKDGKGNKNQARNKNLFFRMEVLNYWINFIAIVVKHCKFKTKQNKNKKRGLTRYYS